MDLTTSIPTSTSIGSVLTSTSTDSLPTSTSADSVPTSTPTPTSAYSGRAISGGAIAGIVIGAVFGLIGTAIGIAGLWYMRRKRSTKVSGQSQDTYCSPGPQRLQPAKSQRQAPQSFELLTTESAQELRRHELMGEGYRAEMQG